MGEKGWIRALMELSVLAAGNPAANDRLTTAVVIEKNDDMRKCRAEQGHRTVHVHRTRPQIILMIILL